MTAWLARSCLCEARQAEIGACVTPTGSGFVRERARQLSVGVDLCKKGPRSNESACAAFLGGLCLTLGRI